MRTRLAHRWATVRASFWLVPGLMVVAAALLAGFVLALDRLLAGTPLPPWVYTGGADGARTLLSTIEGSVVTVAGVAFSITIVALVLASTQFGPRLLSLFMTALSLATHPVAADHGRRADPGPPRGTVDRPRG
jgi:uncharacterized membrane protein